VETKEQWAQRNSGHSNSGHRGTVETEEVLTEEQWAQRNSGNKGTVDTEIQ